MSDNMWEDISTALKDERCSEFIGSRWAFDENGKATCIQEPFITFWSPLLNKFYRDPTHWTPLPKPPVRSA